MPVPEQDMGGSLAGHQRKGDIEVGGPQHQAAAHAVRGVDRAHDAGVVDDRDQVGDAGIRRPAPRAGVGGGVVPVFGVQPGDHLGHAGRAAGELEDRHVVGADVALDLLDDLAGGRQIRAGAQRLDRGSGGAVGSAGAAEDQDVAQGRVIPLLPGGEADEIKASWAGLHEVGDSPDPAADLADFVAAVRGERADRHQSCLEHPVPGEDRAQPVADLEQHRITRRQPLAGQSRGQDVAALVELAVGQPAVERGDGVALRVRARDGVQLIGDRAGAPQARLPVAVRQVSGITHEALPHLLVLMPPPR